MCCCSSPLMSCRENCGCFSATAVSLWAIHAGYGRLLCTLCFLKTNRVGTPASVQTVRTAHPNTFTYCKDKTNCESNHFDQHSLPLKIIWEMSMLLALQILMSYLCSCYGFILFVRTSKKLDLQDKCMTFSFFIYRLWGARGNFI